MKEVKYDEYLECLGCGLEWEYEDFDVANPDECPDCGGKLHQVRDPLT